MVPDSSPVQLRTDDATMLLVAPQLRTLYPDRELQVVARSAGPASSDEGAPTVSISNGDVQLAAEVDFAFQLLESGDSSSTWGGAEQDDLFVITCPMQTTMAML